MGEFVVEILDHDNGESHSYGETREEVVRCRECIHCEEAINGRALCERFSMEGHNGTLYPTVEWDGFCAWGERK